MLLLIHLDNSAALAAHKGSPAAVSTTPRILHFPKDTSLGTLGFNTCDGIQSSPGMLSAKGTVKLNVPSGCVVSLEVFGKVFQNPSLLDTIRNENIESLDVRFMAIDDSEVGTTDRLLVRVPQMRNLEQLHADRSDATDKGFSSIKNMQKLRVLTMFNSEVRGACFKEFSTCPNLIRIESWNCPLDQTNLKYLSALKHLQSLDIRNDGVTDAGIKLIANCSSLQNLSAGNNPIDDRCIPDLRKLENLKDLDLKGTKVTMSGIKLMKGLHLRSLVVPDSIRPTNDPEIVKLMPGVTIVRAKQTPVSPDDMRLFAPLH